MTEEPTPATKDRLGSYDAIETAKPGEPLFPIQGGDPFGPATVLFWVDQCRRAGLAEPNARKAEDLLRKASSAEMVAWQMVDYQKGITEEEAIAKSEGDSVRDRYSGWEDTADEETRIAREQRAARIKATSQIHNVIALSTETAELLATHRVCPEDEVRIREAIDLLKQAAFGCEPRRGNERS